MDKSNKVVLTFALSVLLFFGLALLLTRNSRMLNVYTTIPSTGTTTVQPSLNTTTILPPPPLQTYGPANELQEIKQVDPNATISMFSCTSDANCTLVQTSACFNNLPSQQACINSSYNDSYNASYDNYLNSTNSTVCPQFYLAGTASCMCISNGCTMSYNSSSGP